MNRLDSTTNALPNELIVQPSKIHGNGLFCLEDIKKGTVLGISHVGCRAEDLFPNNIIRTALGAYINCDKENPNCTLKIGVASGQPNLVTNCYPKTIYWHLITLIDIKSGTELTLDYSVHECGKNQEFCWTDKGCK